MSAMNGEIYRTAGFTVKNTFLQLDGPSNASFAGASNMKRACSDSAIWENGGRDCLSDGGDFEGNGDDIQMWGLTDDETDTEGATPGEASLLCYHHIDSDDDSKMSSSSGQPPASGEASSSSQLVAAAREEYRLDASSPVACHIKEAAQVEICEDEQGDENAEEIIIMSDDEDQEEAADNDQPVVGGHCSPTASTTDQAADVQVVLQVVDEERALQERLERMMAENTRLATENSMLKKEVSENRGAASALTQKGELSVEASHPCQAPAQHPPSAPSQTQCMGTWMLPSGATMQTQLACFIMPQFPGRQAAAQASLQAKAGSSQAASAEALATPQGRKARARTARRVVQEGGSVDGVAAPRGPQVQRDVILPAPVKPQPELQHGEVRTTVMLRNMPNNYSRAMLVDLLGNESFAGLYDFLYLPMDFKSRACLGYAFINFVDGETAMRFWAKFDGYSNWAIPSKKVSGVSWSGPRQGFEAHVNNFRNSPVMARSVPDEFKPMVFSGGERVPFPPPTRRVRSPQLGHAHPSQLRQLPS